jgi:poly-beta-1,6-N-acetyl-D-glucosamine synthase
MSVTPWMIVLYSVVFCAVYAQVFFFYAYFEKRALLKKTRKQFQDHEWPTITFLVACWNEEDTAVATVEGLLALDYPKDKLHVCVIDDGSSDKTWERLQVFAHHDHVRLFHKSNGGKHTALNHALPHVTTELVASVDADTFLEHDALKKIAAYFLVNQKTVAVGGTVLIDNPQTLAQKAQSIEYQMFSFSKKVLALLDGVLVVPGAFSVFRTFIFKEVGGYKNAHNLEDLELTYRIQVAGYHVDHAHDAIARTKAPKTIRALFKQRLRWGTGFLRNTRDYSYVLLNSRYGNFGLFTVPMSLLAYGIILTIFFMSWYLLIQGFIDWMIAISLTHGSLFQALTQISFESFSFSTAPVSFVTLMMYTFLFATIFLGRRLARVRSFDSVGFIAYITIYSVIFPLWIIKSVYNTIRMKHTAWR